jgi:hypothetical protein
MAEILDGLKSIQRNKTEIKAEVEKFLPEKEELHTW